MVLVANGLYGLLLIVVHSLLLGDMPDTSSDANGGMGGQDQQAQQQQMSNQPNASGALDASHHWFLALLDLDVSWGHKLLGFDDFSCLLGGLLYGITIIILSMYMFHAVLTGGSYLPVTSRWFVAFMNFEIVLYLGLALAKGPKLCKIQVEFLPNIAMECELLRYLYYQRVLISTVIAGFCCWVFSSFTYLLHHSGFQAMDLPQYADHLDIQGGQTQPPMRSSASLAPYNSQRQVGPQRQSFARAPVGEAMLSRASLAPRAQLASGVPKNSRTSYNIPRATSSMASTATSHSERPLIRPPVAVF